MERLPSVEEREWLAAALAALLARNDLLDATPLIEPTNDRFPEPWEATAAHGHRLAQRMMHYAGLGRLRITLSAYEPDDSDDAWDKGTAGWFAGIDDGRAYFGLHVDQFSDPEAAAGVLAHEVAHAWRAHHGLIVDDRDEEELLTDVTTVVLGFGILSTNNTDRYRSSGDWAETQWTISSAGYLPPQAMAYLLALWTLARGREDERKTIQRHLEPNQRAYFRAALEELAQTDVRALLGAGAPAPLREPAPFTPREPRADEISEPEYEPEDVGTVYRKPRGELDSHLYAGAILGGIFGFLLGVMIFGATPNAAYFALAVIAVAMVLGAIHSRRVVCSECNTRLGEHVAVCPGCGGAIGERREEIEVDDGVDDAPIEPEPRPEGRATFRKLLAAAAIIAIVAALGVAWWRQNHVAVYFDNALGRPLTLQVNGETLAIPGRPPVLRILEPGRHRIVVRDGSRVLETFDADVKRQSLFDALTAPRFYVYSPAGAGIYRRANFAYAVREENRDYAETLIAFERWIEQEPVDYVFTPPPDELSMTRDETKQRTSFEIADDLRFRELAYQWLDEGRDVDAARALRKGLEFAPCDDDLRSDLVGMQDRKDALAETERWVSACDSLIAHRVYQNLLREDRAEELRARYAARLEKQPTAANHYLYGRLLHGDAALAEYREALRLDPKLTWARVAAGHELLALERDAEAFAMLGESLASTDAGPNAPLYFAMAAVALQKQDAAREQLVAAESLDTWEARWLLARSKGDWASAHVYLRDREDTKVFRARVEWDEGGDRHHVIARLRNDPETAYDGELFALEDALQHGRVAEALEIDAKMRTMREPSFHSLYVAGAAMMAKLKPPALRSELQNEPYLLALLDAMEGRIDEATLLQRAADADARLRPHLWFSLGVRAATEGDDARAMRYFRKAAARALDREFAYSVANGYVQAFEKPRAQASR